MKYLWTCGGEFFGYREKDLLFTRDGKCVGRFRGDEVYGSDGRYVGELTSGDRLITNLSKTGWQGPASPWVQGGAVALSNYAGYAMYAGHENFPDPESF